MKYFKCLALNSVFAALLILSPSTQAVLLDLDTSTDWDKHIVYSNIDSSLIDPDTSNVALSLAGKRPGYYQSASDSIAISKWGAAFSKNVVMPDASEVFLAFDLFFNYMSYSYWPSGASGTPWQYSVFNLSVSNGTSTEHFGININCGGSNICSTYGTNNDWDLLPGTAGNHGLYDMISILSPDLNALFNPNDVLTFTFTLREYEQHIYNSSSGGYSTNYHILMGVNEVPNRIPSPAPLVLILGIAAGYFLKKTTRNNT